MTRKERQIGPEATPEQVDAWLRLRADSAAPSEGEVLRAIRRRSAIARDGDERWRDDAVDRIRRAAAWTLMVFITAQCCAAFVYGWRHPDLTQMQVLRGFGDWGVPWSWWP